MNAREQAAVHAHKQAGIAQTKICGVLGEYEGVAADVHTDRVRTSKCGCGVGGCARMVCLQTACTQMVHAR